MESICFVSRRVPPKFSGAGFRAVRQARALTSRGWDCSIYNACNVWETRDSVTFHCPWLPELLLGKGRLELVLFPWLLICSCVWFVRNDPDVVHCIGPGSWFSLASVLAAKINGICTIIEPTMVRGDDPLTLKESRLGLIKNLILTSADGVVSISPAIQERASQAGWKNSENFLVPNPVNCDQFKPAEDEVGIAVELGVDRFSSIITCVGDICPRKGSREIVEVFASIADEVPKTALALVGRNISYEYMLDIKNRVKEEGLMDRVVLPGRSDRVQDWMKVSDVYLFASEQEGLPNAVIEAMSSGVVVIARELEGITEYIIDDGVNGFVVKDKTEMSRKVVNVVNGDIGEESISVNARQTALRRFSRDVITSSYLSVYRSTRGINA